jgi:hypothetical protein
MPAPKFLNWNQGGYMGKPNYSFEKRKRELEKKKKKEEKRQKKITKNNEETQVEQTPVSVAQDTSADNIE